jgi:excisionase family DNA binding protein
MQDQPNPRGLVTVKKAAEFLSMSVAKLYLLMKQGELPYVKVGKSRRLAWSTLEEFVQRCTVGA